VRWGRRETARARALQDIRGAGHREIVGAGGCAACGSTEPREREEAVGGRKGMTGGPDLSAGERGEGGEGGRLGRGPGREKGARGRFGPSRPREGERGRKGIPFFFFQNNFSNEN